jgi:hypothetical protein
MSYVEKRQIVSLLVQEYKIPFDRLAYNAAVRRDVRSLPQDEG